MSTNLDTLALHTAHKHQRSALSLFIWKRALSLSDEQVAGAPDPVSWRALKEHITTPRDQGSEDSHKVV